MSGYRPLTDSGLMDWAELSRKKWVAEALEKFDPSNDRETLLTEIRDLVDHARKSGFLSGALCTARRVKEWDVDVIERGPIVDP
jgi:hypothetical protein